MSGLLGHRGLIMASQYDQAAEELFDRFASTPSTEVRNKINDLIVALKASGDWDRLDSLYMPALAGEAQGGMCDWKRSTKSATANGSAAWSNTNGFQGSTAGGSYFNLDFIPSSDGVNYTQDAALVGAYIITQPTVASHHYGTLAGAGTRTTLSYASATDSYTAAVNSTLTLSSANNSALDGVTISTHRTASSAWGIYTGNNSLITTSGQASFGLSTVSMYACAYNNNGSVAGSSDACLGAMWIGGGFTAEQLNAFHSLIEAYFA